MKVLIMKFSSPSFYFFSLKLKYSSQHFADTLNFSLPYSETKIRTHTKQQANLFCSSHVDYVVLKCAFISVVLFG